MLHKQIISIKKTIKAPKEIKVKLKFKIRKIENELNVFNSNEKGPKDDNIVITLENFIDKKLEETEKRLKETFMQEVQSNSKRVESKSEEVSKKEETYAVMMKKGNPD